MTKVSKITVVKTTLNGGMPFGFEQLSGRMYVRINFGLLEASLLL